jgi:hypothetical protein
MRMRIFLAEDGEAGQEEREEGGVMAFTAHGHHIPNTVLTEPRPQSLGCGPILFCSECIEEVREYWDTHQGIQVPMTIPDDFPAKAKRILINYVDSHYSVDFERPAFEVRVVWFVKVLQHWKALVITDLPDGKYYELTYNGDKRETYVDEYTKSKNTVIPD